MDTLSALLAGQLQVLRSCCDGIHLHNLGCCLVLTLCLASLQASFRSWAYALMAFIFTITTPVGVAIGIGIQSSYNPNSLNALVVSGVFDSISTGVHPLRRLTVGLLPGVIARIVRSRAVQSLTKLLVCLRAEAHFGPLQHRSSLHSSTGQKGAHAYAEAQ